MAFRPLQDTQLSLGNLQEEINRLFERIWHAGVSAGPFDGQRWAPAIDLYERSDRYMLYAEIPGVDANAVDVSYLGNTLTIRGERAKPAGLTEEDQQLRGERRFGAFCRTVELPGEIEAAKLSAKCHAGVLEITVPKSEASKPHTVKIQIKED